MSSNLILVGGRVCALAAFHFKLRSYKPIGRYSGSYGSSMSFDINQFTAPTPEEIYWTGSIKTFNCKEIRDVVNAVLIDAFDKPMSLATIREMLSTGLFQTDLSQTYFIRRNRFRCSALPPRSILVPYCILCRSIGIPADVSFDEEWAIKVLRIEL